MNGQGAYLAGSRWSSAGRRLTFTSEHLSLAILEFFVHLDVEDAPNDLVSVVASIPDDISRISIRLADLPVNWRTEPPSIDLRKMDTRKIGDAFLVKGEAAVLIVPSAVVPSEHNWLINPDHKDAKRIRVVAQDKFRFDPRMF